MDVPRCFMIISGQICRFLSLFCSVVCLRLFAETCPVRGPVRGPVYVYSKQFLRLQPPPLPSIGYRYNPSLLQLARPTYGCVHGCVSAAACGCAILFRRPARLDSFGQVAQHSHYGKGKGGGGGDDQHSAQRIAHSDQGGGQAGATWAGLESGSRAHGACARVALWLSVRWSPVVCQSMQASVTLLP